MEDSIKKGFDFISELSKQLITLSTGILALSITFSKDFVQQKFKKGTGALKWAWLFYLVSICFGVWTMMALTGTVINPEIVNSRETNPFNFNVRFPSGLQIMTFTIGTIMLVVFGIKATRTIK